MEKRASIFTPFTRQCPSCGIPFVIGCTIAGSAQADAARQGLKRVFGMDQSVRIKDSDGIWMGEPAWMRDRLMCKRCGEVVQMF